MKNNNNKHLPLVLVVDDDAPVVKMANDFLSKEGYRITESDCGNSALTLLDRVRPEIIILNAKLSDSDGFDVCKRLRNRPALAAIPILFLLEENSAEAVGLVFKAGANDFVAKPINWMLLCHKLNYLQKSSAVA